MLNYNYANFHLGIERKVFHGEVTRTMVEAQGMEKLKR